MDRTEMSRDRVEQLNKEVNAEDGGDRREDAVTDAAMRPASGAPINRAFAGAEMAGTERSSQSGETADALKRAAENDGRV